jgi:hypothetical protein
MRQEQAEIIGLNALGWLVSNEDLLPVFLSASGASEDELRSNAADPVFLGSVLDFILMDDAWVIACCEAQGLAYELLGQARVALPGGAQVSWT